MISHELDSMKATMNDIDQYGRRISLGFTNIKLDPNIQEAEPNKQMTNIINTKVLKNGTTINESDIDRCHPIGRKVINGRGQVLIKFHSYHKTKEIFYSKSNLRNMDPNHSVQLQNYQD